MGRNIQIQIKIKRIEIVHIFKNLKNPPKHGAKYGINLRELQLQKKFKCSISRLHENTNNIWETKFENVRIIIQCFNIVLIVLLNFSF